MNNTEKPVPFVDPLLGQPIDRLVKIIYHKNDLISEMRRTIEKQEAALAETREQLAQVQAGSNEAECNLTSASNHVQAVEEHRNELIGQLTQAQKAKTILVSALQAIVRIRVSNDPCDGMCEGCSEHTAKDALIEVDSIDAALRTKQEPADSIEGEGR